MLAVPSPPHDVRHEAAARAGEAENRYHAFDVLRASLMLLGVLYHCAIAYDGITVPAIKVWPTSDYLSYMVVASHAFRMPVFFVVAGFFAALLYQRRTPARFTGNRLLRIGLPLVAGWLVLVPLAEAGLTFSVTAYLFDVGPAWDIAWRLLEDGEFFFLDNTSHLWFLHSLLLFYGATLVLAPTVRYVKSASPVLGGLSRYATRWIAIPVLTLPTVVLLYFVPLARVEAPNSFVPDLKYIAFYGFFFAYGAVLYGARDTIGSFKCGAWPLLIGGLILAVLLKPAVEHWQRDGATLSGGSYLLVTALNAPLIWLLMFGLAGVFLRHLDRPITAIRYLADASYWCYLVHLPLAVWLPGLLWQETWAPEVKFAVVACVVLGACLLTYDLLVRPTIIGATLNGRRRPSAIWCALKKSRASLSPEPVVSP